MEAKKSQLKREIENECLYYFQSISIFNSCINNWSLFKQAPPDYGSL